MRRVAASPWSVTLFALALGVSTCQCQQSTPLSPQDRRIKSQIAELPRGVQVTVVMESGSVHRGTVDHFEEVVFWLAEQAQTQPVRIAYNDVSKIKSRNSTNTSTATKKVVEHAIAAAVMACAVILIIVA